MARGGKRLGAGRPKGVPNQVTAKHRHSLSELAKHYVPEALNTLADIMNSGTSDAARVSASIAILDRAFGRPGTVESVDPPANPLEELIREINQKTSTAPIATAIRERK